MPESNIPFGLFGGPDVTLWLLARPQGPIDDIADPDGDRARVEVGPALPHVNIRRRLGATAGSNIKNTRGRRKFTLKFVLPRGFEPKANMQNVAAQLIWDEPPVVWDERRQVVCSTVCRATRLPKAEFARFKDDRIRATRPAVRVRRGRRLPRRRRQCHCSIPRAVPCTNPAEALRLCPTPAGLLVPDSQRSIPRLERGSPASRYSQ